MMRLAVLLLSAWMLAGCGLVLTWAKPGGTRDSFNQDNYACAQESRYMGSTGYGTWASDIDRQHWGTCMRARGWERKIGGDFRP